MRAIQCVDILDCSADALVYSTNILLNCTGGVGGALVQRYGNQVQHDLHEFQRGRGTRYAQQGEVIDLVSPGLPYHHVLHTTPCDAMYDTTPEIVEDVLRRALLVCAQDPAVRRVAVSALATGYGHLQFDQFLPIAARVFCDPSLDPIEDIILCIQDDFTFSLASELICGQSLPLKIGIM